MILGISGKLNSGKDETAKIIQYLTSRVNGNHSLAKDKSLSSFITYEEYSSGMRSDNYIKSDWQVRKFAGKLKEIVCLLTGCSMEDLEDQDFKNKFLGVDWDVFTNIEPTIENTISSFDLANQYGYNFDVIEKTHTSEARQKIKDECIAKAKKEGYELVRTLKPAFSDRYWIPKVEREQRTYRWMLQQIGTEAMRGCIHENVWVNSLFADYKQLGNYVKRTSASDKLIDQMIKAIEGVEIDFDKVIDVAVEEHNKLTAYYPNWLISDMRFPNEKKAIEDRGGITIRVNRKPKSEAFLIDMQNNTLTKVEHPSETALDNEQFTYVIDNNGTIQDLVEKVREILIKEKLI